MRHWLLRAWRTEQLGVKKNRVIVGCFFRSVCGSGWVKTQSDRPWTPPRSFLWKASWGRCGACGASSISPPRTASFFFEDASLHINRSLGYSSCEKVRQNYVAVKWQNPNVNNDNKTTTVAIVDV